MSKSRRKQVKEKERERNRQSTLSLMQWLLYSHIFSFSYFGWLQISVVLFNFVVGWHFEEYYMLWYYWKNEKRENRQGKQRKKTVPPRQLQWQKAGEIFTFRQMKMSPREACRLLMASSFSNQNENLAHLFIGKKVLHAKNLLFLFSYFYFIRRKVLSIYLGIHCEALFYI